ncbi:hypothetical protein [Streptosporangium longisporum]|uniref:Uncharacterized protein n=1 Tax=Streptosporangium longisporum TaxID=46187 RepID=A0ABN3Y3L0_9ACTN
MTTTSALLFGILGWLAAHGATGWLAGHAGHGLGRDVIPHQHAHLPTTVLLVACLAGGSLLAIFVAALSGSTRLHPDSRWDSHRVRLAAARRSGLLSTGAFVAAEFAEHAATGQHDIPPAGVLLMGCTVHAVLGAVFSLLWGCFVRGVVRRAGRLRSDTTVNLDPRIRLVSEHRIAARRTWQALAQAGRAPPAAPVL